MFRVRTSTSVARRPFWAAAVAAVWLAPDAALADVALDQALTACTTIANARNDHDWASTLGDWAPVPRDADLTDAFWAWYALNEFGGSVAPAFEDPDEEAFEYHWGQIEGWLPREVADGYVVRFQHPTGWHIAIDRDHELFIVSCRLWHEDDQWDTFSALYTSTNTPTFEADADAPVREIGLTYQVISNGFNTFFVVDGVVLAPGIQPEAPRSFILIKTTQIAPEDGG